LINLPTLVLPKFLKLFIKKEEYLDFGKDFLFVWLGLYL
jgi:hypothetical protein